MALHTGHRVHVRISRPAAPGQQPAESAYGLVCVRNSRSMDLQESRLVRPRRWHRESTPARWRPAPRQRVPVVLLVINAARPISARPMLPESPWTCRLNHLQPRPRPAAKDSAVGSAHSEWRRTSMLVQSRQTRLSDGHQPAQPVGPRNVQIRQPPASDLLEGRSPYGNICFHMKTTVELPDALFVAVKKKAAEDRTTLRAILERALRRELGDRRGPRTRPPHGAIRWVTVKGGVPEGLDIADRAAMHDWLRRNRPTCWSTRTARERPSTAPRGKRSSAPAGMRGAGGFHCLASRSSGALSPTRRAVAAPRRPPKRDVSFGCS
jgi:hypothetical protein